MVTVGDTANDALAWELVPTSVVNVELLYHFHDAPVPRLPPVCVSVVLWVPVLQRKVEAAFKLVGATDGWLTVIVTLIALLPTFPEHGLVVPSALK